MFEIALIGIILIIPTSVCNIVLHQWRMTLYEWCSPGGGFKKETILKLLDLIWSAAQMSVTPILIFIIWKFFYKYDLSKESLSYWALLWWVIIPNLHGALLANRRFRYEQEKCIPPRL